MAQEFDVQKFAGLTEQEAARRLLDEGANELPSSQRRSGLAIAFEVVREPMFLLLAACGVVYLLLGEPREAMLLLSFVVVIMGITIVQERRTERALESLRDLSSPRALVVRDGRQRRIAGRDVARGDMMILQEGDRVPADAILRQCVNLWADESLLTGESAPVRKTASSDTPAISRPGGDDLPFVFSGSLITRGQGIAEALATGLHSELGKIGKSLQMLEPEKTLLQKETGRLVKTLAIVGFSLCAVVIVLYAITRGNDLLAWQQGFLAGITLAMATLPEEFPVVLTIFLAMGAWRISRHRVLTRRIPAIETLGAATVLCVDKTGTLTQNKMSIRKLSVAGKVFDAEDTANTLLPEEFHEVMEFGILASKKDPFDPMEKALRELGDKYLARTDHLHNNWSLEREYPLSPELLALSHVWKSSDGRDVLIAAKGAPEAIADLCHFDGQRLDAMSKQVAMMADEGLRVLGVARGRPVRRADLPKDQHDFEFDFMGLVGLADPVRPTVPQSIQECYTAGMRVVMITGDYPGTAKSVGRQIGLKNIEEIITGPELEQMSEAEIRQRIIKTNIIARVAPEQKLLIVNALKANGEIVAMTGDGVNDAPALKAAHIGIGMGGRGTDVAREASGIVLLDDDFSSIVQAVRLGRRIFDNIKKAISYIFAIHVPIAGLSLVPVFIPDWPLILLPVHIVFLELIIDPSCTMIFEAEPAETDIMTRRPRNPSERLFSLKSLSISILQGISVLVIVLGVFLAARSFGHNNNNARGLTFAALVVANIALILTNRSWTRTIWAMVKVANNAVWLVVGGAAIFLGLVLYTPALRDTFHFGQLHPFDLIICLIAGALSVLWFECLKIVHKRPQPI